jgi:hypothetical protein
VSDHSCAQALKEGLLRRRACATTPTAPSPVRLFRRMPQRRTPRPSGQACVLSPFFFPLGFCPVASCNRFQTSAGVRFLRPSRFLLKIRVMCQFS